MSQRYVNSPSLKNSAVILMIKGFSRSLRRNEKKLCGSGTSWGDCSKAEPTGGSPLPKPGGSPSNQPFTS